MTSTAKVAVVQAAPVAFDRERTLDKVHALTGDAAQQGAELVLFPEAFVSAYPRGLDFGAVVGSRTDEGREDFRRYWESSVDVPGPAVDALAARRGRTASTSSSASSNATAARSIARCCSSGPTARTSASTASSCRPRPSG